MDGNLYNISALTLLQNEYNFYLYFLSLRQVNPVNSPVINMIKNMFVFFQLSVVQQVMCNIMLLLLFLRLQLLTSCKKCWYLAPQRQATLSNHVQGIPRNPFKFLLFRFFAWAWIILWQLPYKGLSTRKSSLHDWTCPAEWLLLTSCRFSLTPFCENLSPSWL